MKGIRKLFYF